MNRISNSILLDNLITIPLLKLASSIYNSRNGGFILCYHQIESALFEKHLDVLSNYIVVSLSEMVERKKKSKSTKGLLVITVDDCYENTLSKLSEVCVTHQIPITFYAPVDFINGRPLRPFVLKNIVSSLVGSSITLNGNTITFDSLKKVKEFHSDQHANMYYKKEEAYMPIWESVIDQLIHQKKATAEDFLSHAKPVSWEYIKEKSKYEVLSFQSHGISHQPVSELSSKELEGECLDSKLFIENITNKKVNHFCYPYGSKRQIGNKAQKIIAKHFDSAVTMVRGRLDKANDNYMLPRIPLYDIDSGGRALLKTLTS
jgi:peptidoglycan/xylan/chitin deacetylase (PgdA/CDA1 family)